MTEPPPDDGAAEAEPSSKKRRLDEDGSALDEAGVRFRLGQRVLCNMSNRPNYVAWQRGKVSMHWQEKNDIECPYVVELDDGRTSWTVADDDDCIRLAARATRDLSVMRASALPQERRGGVHLRFLEGARVAVQLDVGNWEEGTVIEVWAAPRRAGRILKSWAGLAVPYKVHLDLGDDVMVPFDDDEVIRTESAARPRQKSVAEQLGGRDRTPANPAGQRFVKRQNSAGRWVIADTTTGKERPCAPPDPDDDA